MYGNYFYAQAAVPGLDGSAIIRRAVSVPDGAALMLGFCSFRGHQCEAAVWAYVLKLAANRVQSLPLHE